MNLQSASNDNLGDFEDVERSGSPDADPRLHLPAGAHRRPPSSICTWYHTNCNRVTTEIDYDRHFINLDLQDDSILSEPDAGMRYVSPLLANRLSLGA